MMGRDQLPAFPTPSETFADPPPPRRQPSSSPFGGVPPPPVPKYGPDPYAQSRSQGYRGYGNSPSPAFPQPPATPNQFRPPPSVGSSRPGTRPSPRGPPPRVSGHGGYNYDPPPPRSSSPESNLRALFNGVDRNHNGRLSESELASALVNGDYSKFDRDTVRLMIRMFDRDGDGAIDFEEFGNLWRYLRAWRKIFDKFDVNKNGIISFDEYCRATTRFGYNLSVPCIQYMYDSYTHLDRYGHRTMSFDLFVQSFIHLKRTTDSFKKFDTDRDGYITLGFEQYLLEAVSLK